MDNMSVIHCFSRPSSCPSICSQELSLLPLRSYAPCIGCTDNAATLPLLHPPTDLLAMLAGGSESVLVKFQRGGQRFAPLQDVEL
jgi:hypothetical protein